ncbi:hypothetical protein ASD38_09965 [Caulobacter sp. Root487D2Y]|jgi:hypothetical protein|uniref:NMCC_0638 family (lipo)protein n=1 Tax=Caulobacter sp. Root487D2Y TaxID=1736547 RepID=UPI0006F96889|nr:hypothetical protein [Caulobacter sp. Root487D2Y]KQY29649.1 hypothetical protein ASD38_09965 [Caulobacter sp. Root487D2Y]
MRALATILISTALLAAGSAQAAPTYRQEVVDVFKSVCLPAGTNAAAVAVSAAKLGWKPAPASIKAMWQGPATKVWVSPANARFYLAQSPQGGFCQVGYYDGAQPVTSDPAAFAQLLRAIMIHAGIAVGSGFVKISESDQLMQQGHYVSPAYPGLKMDVVAANFPDAPNFLLNTAKP